MPNKAFLFDRDSKGKPPAPITNYENSPLTFARVARFL